CETSIVHRSPAELPSAAPKRILRLAEITYPIPYIWHQPIPLCSRKSQSGLSTSEILSRGTAAHEERTRAKRAQARVPVLLESSRFRQWRRLTASASAVADQFAP